MAREFVDLAQVRHRVGDNGSNYLSDIRRCNREVLPRPNGSSIQKAVIGDGDAMGIAAEVAQNVLWSAEGRFGVNDPVLAKQGAAKFRITEAEPRT